ncbi:MAG: cyclic pyranopterin monophosphate synthase MoaC [Selenomonadaceae bacterium]|nr:cyclic pyranopterin monophosphate synthase MoaC [Selenomonadaceae bacterium]
MRKIFWGVRPLDSRLNHFDAAGNAVMVDVGGKSLTERTAIASGKIFVGAEVYRAIESATAKKGDVLGVARVAGIMAAKKTSDVIPLCHPLPLSHCRLEFEMLPDEGAVKAVATVKTTWATGVEMEALHAVSVALLTIYDMCKAIDKRMTLGEIHLERKSGGKSGEFYAANEISRTK